MKDKRTHKINEEIRHPKIRVVDFGEKSGIYSTKEALALADEEGLDLIEITINSNPPICKIMEYSKFAYEQKKKEKEQLRKQKENNKELKEIRFTSNTDEGDIETKKRKIVDFLKEGHKVKTVVIFKGRELQYKKRGELLLLNLAQDIEDVGKVDSLPKLEGKNMIMMLSPKR